LLLLRFALRLLQFVLMLGAQKFFCLGHRESANGYAADYGTLRRFQKYDVINAITELPQNIQTTL